MNLKEIQAATELADLLYEFLPGKPHPYGKQEVSFPGCAAKLGLSQFWQDGSKKSAIIFLLQNTLERARGKFCNLVIEIVKTAIPYRQQKKNPVTREEILALNKKIAEVGFKIPELWDDSFLQSLPSRQPAQPAQTSSNKIDISTLKKEYIDLSGLEPHTRGYAFEKFLNKLFEAFGLSPKAPFRLTGEQIDGSFELDSQTYLLEAKWQKKQSAQEELLIFNGKVEGKSSWARGLFISYIGFTSDGLDAFARGKRTSIIGMDGTDIYFILDGKISLIDAINKKLRSAAETNDFFVSVHALI